MSKNVNFCTSMKHQEYSCMIKWSVDKRFGAKKWCANCINHYADSHIVKSLYEEV